MQEVYDSTLQRPVPGPCRISTQSEASAELEAEHRREDLAPEVTHTNLQCGECPYAPWSPSEGHVEMYSTHIPIVLLIPQHCHKPV